MNMPCADDKMPSPQEVRKAPSRSRTIKGCALRLNKYTRSRASVTMPVWPRVQPAGSLAQSSTNSYVYLSVPTVAISISSSRWRPLYPLQRRSWLFSYPAELLFHPMLLDDLIAIPPGNPRNNHRTALVLAVRRGPGTIEGHRPRQ